MIQRALIGILGKMNVGKSTLMNAITQQNTSIVDDKPGTTADSIVSLMQLHKVGATKIFDTAGIDEMGILGDKKRDKTFQVLKEVDLVLLVIDPFHHTDDFSHEKELLELAEKHNKKVLLFFNLFQEKMHSSYNYKVKAIYKELKTSFPYLMIDLSDITHHSQASSFIEENFSFMRREFRPFPFLEKGDLAFLNIPMDAETPEERLLRPQALIQENLLRRYIATIAYRMDLQKARSQDKKEREEEKRRFLGILFPLIQEDMIKVLITDSQAIDIIDPWTKDYMGNSIIDITTFSILMAHLQSGGRLDIFTQGVEAFQNLQKEDKILIAEACNHNRIAEDIGTVQLPEKIRAYFNNEPPQIDHLFGRDFSNEKLKEYKLIIHCGGCMIDKQKMQARLHDLFELGVPITNYGVLLSFLQSAQTLKRTLKPFGIKFSINKD